MYENPREGAPCKVEVGGFCAMRIEGSKFRVLVVSEPTIDDHDECRAEVIVMEKNPFVKVGARCRPLAHTLRAL